MGSKNLDLDLVLSNRWVRIGEHVLFVAVATVALKILVVEGPFGVLRAVSQSLRALPGVNSVIELVLSREVKGAASLLLPKKQQSSSSSSSSSTTSTVVSIPVKGENHADLLSRMNEMAEQEKKAAAGKIFAYVYTFDEKLKKTVTQVYRAFSESLGLPAAHPHHNFVYSAFEQFVHGNALNPFVFGSLRKFETEVVAMSAALFHGDSEVVGTMTSGGTESILMAVKTYRDRARKLRPHVTNPEMIAAVSVHPAFEKAAHYFGVKIIHVPLEKETFKMDVAAARAAINRNTILIVASAPQYPHCVVDPVEKLGQLAEEFQLPLHVDACYGGFMLPWLEKLGMEIPKWDFRVPQVTSISADMHKYGYCPKGASVILYRDSSLRQFQFFAYSQWPGGLFGSPSMSGTRPGGNIAAAWGTFMAIGQEGYLSLAKEALEATEEIKDGIRSILGLKIMGTPQMTGFAFLSSDSAVDILAVADVMETHGWKIERQQLPASIHCSIYPAHAPVAAKFVEDLKTSVDAVRKNRKLASEGTAGMYGMVANIPDQTLVEDFIIKLFGEVFRV